MKNFFKKMIMMAVMALAMLFGFTAPAVAQMSKLSPATRMIIADRDGKMSIEKVNAFAKGHQPTKTQTLSVNGKTMSEKLDFSGELEGTMHFVEPFTVDGVKMAQCWIKMTDNNYSAIEALGVKILAKFDGMVTANIPVKVLEKVAALKNVKKVSVSEKAEPNTYYAREATNVDDVLNFSADAQAAGLLQAYDGTGVVIGIIDTGIQFDHQIFKDDNGNTRIKLACVYDSESEELVWYESQSAIEALTYDTNSTYHGSHTSSIAGGSNFTFNGYYYDNSTSSYVNGSRVYGGMAPKADLVLCGLAGELSHANIAACIQRISQYADQVGKPCVISISLGNQAGPHDGTGYLCDVYEQYMSGPGKVIVKAASNDANTNLYLYKSATKSAPAMSVLDCHYYDGYTSGNYTLNNYFLYGQSLTYARTPGVEMAAKYYVIDTSTNTIVWVSDEVTSDMVWSVNSDETDPDATYDANLAQYFSAASDGGGYLCAFFDTDAETGKQNIYTNVFYLKAEGSTQSGYTVTGKYKIGVSFYPKNSGITLDIDSWGLNEALYESASANFNGTSYTFAAGNDLCSISDDCTSSYVIPIGSYSTMMSWAASNGSGYTLTQGTLSDIAPSSGYQAEGSGPLGNKLPWITAPGQMIVAAYNRGWVANNSSSTYLLYQYDSTNPLGVASGTSMASPCAGGIVALWLQVDPTLTIEDVKTLMQETAIKDSYVTGTNASHFGQGKIDALAGIQALLPDGPRIGATPQDVTMSSTVGNSATKTVSVRGANLTTRVNFTLSDANGVFRIDKQYVTRDKAQSTEGAEFTITFTPTVEGTYTATVTLSSTGAEDVIVTINGKATEAGGTASDAYLNIAKYATIDEAGFNNSYVNPLYAYTETINVDEPYAWLTLPVYGAWSSVYYSPKAQNWIKTSVTSASSSYYADATWNATDVYKGSGTYFSGLTARAIYGSNQANTARTVTFYVTNATAVKLLGRNGNSSSNNRVVSMTIYECTDNGDGTLSEGTTAVTTQRNTTTNSNVNLSYENLDAEKIYKVVASVTRGYLYEIGFKTPLKKGTITADPTSLTFETIVGEPVTQTFHVTGENLKDKPITATVTAGSNVYTIDKNNITATEAENGGVDVTVTFTPTAAGTNISGTVTLSSQGAKDDVTVTLNGTAHARSLIADPTELTFKCLKGQTDSKTFDVLGEYLKEGVTLTLADDNGVFSIDKTSLTKAEAEDGATVTVTFSPTVNGDYTGTVTLSSDGVEDVIVYLTATSYPDYFTVNISQYGLTTLYVDFPLVIPYDTYDPDLLGVWYVNSADGKEVRLAEVFDYIPANTGVIVQGNEGSYDFPRYQGTVDPIEGNLLYGSLERTTPDNALKAANASSTSIVMTLGMGKSMVGFYKYTGKYLNANKAYLIYDKGAQSNVNMLSIGGMGGEFTGINDINARFDEGAWYTLQGIRLNGKPLQRGVYLHNGKAVVVR